MQTETREDRRILRTKRALRIACINILRTKQIDTITVKELTDYADISRGTFYLHYDSVNAVLSDIFQRSLTQLKADFSLCRFNLKEKPVYYDLVFILFDFIDKNTIIFSALYNKDDGAKYNAIIAKIIKKKIYAFWKSAYPNIDDSILNFYFTIFIGALFRITTAWFRNGKKYTPEYMANFISKAFDSGFTSMMHEQSSAADNRYQIP